MLRKSNYLSNRTIQGGVGWALEELFLTHGRGTELEGLTGNKIPSLNEKKKIVSQIEISKGGISKKKKVGKKKCEVLEKGGDRGGPSSDDVKDREKDREIRENAEFILESGASALKNSARLA